MAKRRFLPTARSAVVWLGLLISAGFAYIAVRNARLEDVWSALVASDYIWIVPGLAALALWFLIRVVRWRSLFGEGRHPPFRAVASALFVGYLFNTILPARAGEAARIVALNRRARTSLAETTATVVIERVFDLLSLLLLLFLMLPWLPDLTWVQAAGVLAAALVLALAGVAIVLLRFGDRPLAFAFRQLARVPLLPEHRLRNSAANFFHGLLALRRPRTALVAFAWTTLSWIIIGLGTWSVMHAFDLGLSPLAGELVVIGVGLALVLPSSPAGLGVFEGAVVLVLGTYGVSDSEALSYALVLHAVNVLPFLVLAPPVLRPYGALLSAAKPDRAAPAPRAGT